MSNLDSKVDDVNPDDISQYITTLSDKLTKSTKYIDALKKSLNNANKINWKQYSINELKKIKNQAIQLNKHEQQITKQNIELKKQINKFKYEIGKINWDNVLKVGYPKTNPDESKFNIYKSKAGKEVKVTDEYQYLEDNDNDNTKQWIKSQVSLCNNYLSMCNDRDKIYDDLENNINFPRYSTPQKRGKGNNKTNIFTYTYNTGLQNQSVLYYIKGDSDPFKCSKAIELIDPNKLSDDGTVSLGGTYYSYDAKYLCYGLKRSGSDWVEFQVKNIETGKDEMDLIKWCKFTGISWTPDNKGFFYTRYNPPKKFEDAKDDDFKRGTETEQLKNQQLFYHVLGTKQEDDIFLIDAVMLGDKEYMIGTEISDDDNYLMVYISKDCDPVNKLYLLDIKDKNIYLKPVNDNVNMFEKKLVKFIDNFDSGYDYILNNGNIFYFKTNKDAPNYKVVSCDVSKNEAQFIDVIKQSDSRLIDVSCVNNDKLLLKYNENVKHVIKLVDLQGKEVKHNIKFPSAGSVYFRGERQYNDAFFYFTSFLYPGTIYYYSFTDSTMKPFKEIKVNNFEPNLYETKQVWYESKDKTKIPMYMILKKGIKLDGNNPTILYGYGGFDISLMPGFRVSRVLWVKNTNGIYCVANLRGGGEFGESWHKQGTKDKKQNVFNDFQCAAKYLIDSKYTCVKKLAIEGGSNGGLLVAACSNQEPALFQCSIAHCGVLDMLKFHKYTIGYAWISDYGNPDKPDEFDAIYKYSPLNNIPKKINNNHYPCFMATTADHDDRVSPLHSFKFVAKLQDTLGKSTKNPLLIRIELKSGHGSSSLTKDMEMRADVFAFVLKSLNAKWNS